MTQPSSEGERRGPIAWMARNSVAANLAIVFLIVGGLLVAPRVKQEVFPEFDLDLVIVSVGTLLAAVGLFSREALAAGLYYLVHSTLVTGGLFLLADLIGRQRGEVAARLDRSRAVYQPALLGTLFFVAAVAVSGLPPLSGFAAKLYILQAAGSSGAVAWVWGVILISGLFVIVSLSRAGTAIFWRTEGTLGEARPVRGTEAVSTGGLLAGALFLMIFGAGVLEYTEATAEQLLDRSSYVDAVLANESVSTPASFKE